MNVSITLRPFHAALQVSPLRLLEGQGQGQGSPLGRAALVQSQQRAPEVERGVQEGGHHQAQVTGVPIRVPHSQAGGSCGGAR